MINDFIHRYASTFGFVKNQTFIMPAQSLFLLLILLFVLLLILFLILTLSLCLVCLKFLLCVCRP